MDYKDRLNWAEAAANGQKRFKMSSPCVNGHVGERYTNGNGTCVECQKMYQRRRKRPTRVVITLVDPAHVTLIEAYARTLNAHAKATTTD